MLTVRQRVQASRVMGEVERPAPNDLELKSGLRCVFQDPVQRPTPPFTRQLLGASGRALEIERCLHKPARRLIINWSYLI
jgi:hypothetical protein